MQIFTQPPVKQNYPVQSSQTTQPLATEELTPGQRSAAFQDALGAEAVMPHMKKANAVDQLHAMKKVIKNNSKQNIKVLDIGGGDGLTAPVMKTIKDKKASVEILNIEKLAKYEQQYREAHEAAGVNVKGVLEMEVKDLTVETVTKVFPTGVDVVFASHSMYFEMDAMFDASNQVPDIHDAQAVGQWVENHPMTKYLDAMAEGGVFAVTLGSAQELKTIRTIILGGHNLQVHADPSIPRNDIDVKKTLECFKNMQFFAKHFECFKPYYEAHRACTIECKTYSSITKVPLGKFNVSLNETTGLYEVHNPEPQPIEQFHAPAVFRWLTGPVSAWPTTEEVAEMNPQQVEATFQKQKVLLNMLPTFQVGNDLSLRDETMSIQKRT